MTKQFQICIFEDDICKNITPYQLTRPAYTIPIGSANLVEKISQYAPDVRLTLLASKHHELFLKRRFEKVPVNILNKSLPTLYLNARLNLTYDQYKSLIADINFNKNNLFIGNQTVVGLYYAEINCESVFQLLNRFPSFDSVVKKLRNESIVREKKAVSLVSNWWNYLDQFAAAVESDFNFYSNKSLIEGDISSFTTLTHDSNMAISRTATIHEYVSIDASNGPVIIMDNVSIKPFSRIEGPCYIGPNTTIQTQADIAGSYIGEHCKVGGEVKQSIIQSYTNKGHHGYLGDSLVGEWVNLGAGTTTSNLKLSYGDVQTKSGPANEVSSSNRQFLGSLIGDYVKTSINTTLDCGSIIGSGSSLYGSDVHSKFIPPFTWGCFENYGKQDIAAFLTALERMMIRRNQHINDNEVNKLKGIYDAVSELLTTKESS